LTISWGVVFQSYLPELLEDPLFCNRCLPGAFFFLKCKGCKRIFFGKDVKKEMIKHLSLVHGTEVRVCLESLVDTSLV